MGPGGYLLEPLKTRARLENTLRGLERFLTDRPARTARRYSLSRNALGRSRFHISQRSASNARIRRSAAPTALTEKRIAKSAS